MLSSHNRVVVACAGAGKTTAMVDEALAIKNGRILITTYTLENLGEIKAAIIRKAGCIPSNIDIISWFSFLFNEAARPYHNFCLPKHFPIGIDFTTHLDHWHSARLGDRYYLNSTGDIYKDLISALAIDCNRRSKGLVLARIARIYTHIFVDEFQDISGYDLDFFESLLGIGITVVAVGDPRQGIFSTNNSRRNSGYSRSGIIEWIYKKRKVPLFEIEEKTTSYRCNQQICDFADKLFPELPRTTSLNSVATGNDGVFTIPKNEAIEYYNKFAPTILRYREDTDTLGLPARNIGIVKGKTFDQVLIFPTEKMLKFLKSGKSSDAGDRGKFYVAVTRAKYSVAFVMK
jgi:DNA helicase II / ATP-dependent DNA helicase PcrA